MAYAYEVKLENTSIAAAAVLALIRPSATVGFRIRRMRVTQSGTATSGQVRVRYGRKASAFATGLTSFTPLKLDEKDAASGLVGGTTGAAGTVGVNSTSVGAGTFTTLDEVAFNVLNGFEVLFSDSEAPVMRANSAEGFQLDFPATPAPTTGWNILIIFEEI